jgi:hypothetical protein
MLLFGQKVEPGTREDIALFWTDGERSRVILGCGYAEVHAVLERILRRFPNGVGHYQQLRAKIGELGQPGAVVATVLGPHRIGLMIPWRAGEAGPLPYVVCREQARVPDSPVIRTSLEHARLFARQASLHTGLSRCGWRAFRGERLRSPIERLFARTIDGRVILRSELEEELGTARHSVRPATPMRRKAA